MSLNNILVTFLINFNNLANLFAITATRKCIFLICMPKLLYAIVMYTITVTAKYSLDSSIICGETGGIFIPVFDIRKSAVNR